MATDWITEGAQVAEYTHSNPATADVSVVERLTATQIVLSNGHRFHRDTLRPVGDSNRNAWSPSTILLPAADSRVRDALATEWLRKVIHRVHRVERAGVRHVVDVLGALDQIEAAVTKARAAISD